MYEYGLYFLSTRNRVSESISFGRSMEQTYLKKQTMNYKRLTASILCWCLLGVICADPFHWVKTVLSGLGFFLVTTGIILLITSMTLFATSFERD